MNMPPQGFFIGPVFIYYYGIIITAGAIAAAFLGEREARRRGLNGELVWDALVWLLIAGIIGARLWHIFTPPPNMFTPQGEPITTLYYLTHPLDAIWIRNGGLGIPGAIIGGGLALYWFCKRQKLSFALWADIAAPSVALAQAIGRWGNFTNQELYGYPTTLPWGISVLNPPAAYTADTRFHPLFLYESLWNLANMFFLIWLNRRFKERLQDGDLFIIYIIGYSIGRFLLEFLRIDASQVAGININQTFVMIAGLVSAALLILRHRRKPAEA
jgi:phosphatidylglycerol:prolipoprotein diacylglycerol transferase